MSLDILLFGVLSVLAIAWLVLVHWLARRLRKLSAGVASDLTAQPTQRPQHGDVVPSGVR